jgi:cation transporter-like permease
VSQAGFGITGALGATGLIGHRERKRGKVVADERDREIAQTSLAIAFAAFWVLFLIAAVVPMLVLGPRATVHTTSLTAVAWASICFVFVVRSAVTVIMYRRGIRE